LDATITEKTITNALLVWDILTDFDMFESSYFGAIHQRWVERTDPREAMAVPEITADRATRARVVEGSRDFTFPFVIRGAVAETASVQRWADPRFWLDGYADELVLCTSASASGLHPLAQVFARSSSATPLYVAGAATIFERRPELKAMVDTPLTQQISPKGVGKPPLFHQMFLGWRHQGTTVHCAIGINLFHQIAGRKKWYFMAPSQTPWVWPKIYSNGYSATSRTIQANESRRGAAWFDRLERYSVTLEPGDLLINPPWWWHCVENVGEPDELVIGCPTRFDCPRRAFGVDPFKSAIAVWRHVARRPGFGKHGGGIDDALAFERSLIENRNETYQSLVLR
jgi:hypothetical protein